jgi:hypothetical protein
VSIRCRLDEIQPLSTRCDITPRKRAELRDGLQEPWEASLDERGCLAERSVVAVLDGILAGRKGTYQK